MAVNGDAPQPSSSADDVPAGRSPPREHARQAAVAHDARTSSGFVRAVRDSDDAVVDDTVTRLSRVRPWLTPLTLAIGAFAMLFDEVNLLFTNWRLTLVQVLPAMWIWGAPDIRACGLDLAGAVG